MAGENNMLLAVASISVRYATRRECWGVRAASARRPKHRRNEGVPQKYVRGKNGGESKRKARERKAARPRSLGLGGGEKLLS